MLEERSAGAGARGGGAGERLPARAGRGRRGAAAPPAPAPAGRRREPAAPRPEPQRAPAPRAGAAPAPAPRRQRSRQAGPAWTSRTCSAAACSPGRRRGAIGLAFLIALAVSSGWIGEGARTVIAGVAASALLGAGIWLHEPWAAPTPRWRPWPRVASMFRGFGHRPRRNAGAVATATIARVSRPAAAPPRPIAHPSERLARRSDRTPARWARRTARGLMSSARAVPSTDVGGLLWPAAGGARRRRAAICPAPRTRTAALPARDRVRAAQLLGARSRRLALGPRATARGAAGARVARGPPVAEARAAPRFARPRPDAGADPGVASRHAELSAPGAAWAGPAPAPGRVRAAPGRVTRDAGAAGPAVPAPGRWAASTGPLGALGEPDLGNRHGHADLRHAGGGLGHLRPPRRCSDGTLGPPAWGSCPTAAWPVGSSSSAPPGRARRHRPAAPGPLLTGGLRTTSPPRTFSCVLPPSERCACSRHRFGRTAEVYTPSDDHAAKARVLTRSALARQLREVGTGGHQRAAERAQQQVAHRLAVHVAVGHPVHARARWQRVRPREVPDMREAPAGIR